MLKSILILIAGVSVTVAAEDTWPKVRDLKTGTELRIVKKGSVQPLIAQLAEVTDENLVVFIKNEQSAIPREQIDRIDFRPEGSRMKKETKYTPHDPKPRIDNPRGSSGPNSSYSSGVVLGDKPAFEVIYRRPRPTPPAPKQEP